MILSRQQLRLLLPLGTALALSLTGDSTLYAVLPNQYTLVGISLGVGGLLSALVHLVVAALVLMVAGNMISGLRVKGFGGALVGAIALAVVAFLVEWVIGLFI